LSTAEQTSVTKLCECGCGQPAPIATMTNRKRGYVAGRPMRFVKGHNNCGHTTPVEERFWAKVQRDGPLMPDMETVCWQWTGAKTVSGLGVIGVGGAKTALAHRVAYELLVAPIDDDEEAGYRVKVRHRCGNTLCVNPDHLEVTRVVAAQARLAQAQIADRRNRCACGCGQLAPIATATNRAQGYVAGEAMQFVYGHHFMPGDNPTIYVAEDRKQYAVDPEPAFPQHPVVGKVCKCENPVVLLDGDDDERCFRCGKLTLSMMMTTLLLAMGSDRDG
jgi:hypothetical protein